MCQIRQRCTYDLPRVMARTKENTSSVLGGYTDTALVRSQNSSIEILLVIESHAHFSTTIP